MPRYRESREYLLGESAITAGPGLPTPTLQERDASSQEKSVQKSLFYSRSKVVCKVFLLTKLRGIYTIKEFSERVCFCLTVVSVIPPC